MGESVDLTNNSSNDTAAVRWDIGEDIPNFGVIRNMMNPTRFGDPDRAGSPNYYCGTDNSYYVHIDSGVSNKAFALMVDGGTFNNFTIAGIGIDKALKVEYRANDLYLTESSQFIDAYNALNRSCNELYGAGSADCGNVLKALQATNMNGSVCGVAPVPEPTPGPTPTATPIPVPVVVNGNFEAGRNVGWAESSVDSAGSYEVVVAKLGQNGSWGAYLAGGMNIVSQLTQSYSVDARASNLHFAYRLHSEDVCGWDYGYVMVNDTVLRTYNLCKTNETNGFVLASLNLSAYAGQTVTLKFRATTDSSLTSEFFIDDVSFSAAALNEEADPHASTGPITPEPKPTATNEQTEAAKNQIFLPLVNK